MPQTMFPIVGRSVYFKQSFYLLSVIAKPKGVKPFSEYLYPSVHQARLRDRTRTGHHAGLAITDNKNYNASYLKCAYKGKVIYLAHCYLIR
jgi:hypothetical protein